MKSTSQTQIRPFTLIPLLLLILSTTLLRPPAAKAVEIALSASHPGPVAVGDIVTITLSVNDWDQSDPEVDGISFNVDFDPAIFEFVAGSGMALANGSEFLALPNQGVDYLLEDQTDDSLAPAGRFIFGAIDSEDFASGSMGPGGDVGSFQLRAIAPGTSAIEPTATLPGLVFFDRDLFGITPSEGIKFTGQQLEVSSPPILVTYAAWAATFPWQSPADRQPAADPDCDGLDNETEYALGGNPLEPDVERLPEPTFVIIANNTHFALEYSRPGGDQTRSDLTYSGEAGKDLINWTTDVVETVLSPPDPVTGLELVQVRSADPIDPGQFKPREFLRLRFSLQTIGAGP